MFDGLLSVSALNFFSLNLKCYHLKKEKCQKKHLLINTAKFFLEEKFTDVSLGWNEKGLTFHFDVDSLFIESDYPNFRNKDSIELFIDTKDNKNSNIVTKYCHYFVLFPKKIDGYYAKEITKFRADDMHDICDSEDLDVKVNISKKKYEIDLFIPQNCLFGFDVTNFKRLGFTYRINRKNLNPQHFSCSSFEYSIESHPNLWASLQLVKGD